MRRLAHYYDRERRRGRGWSAFLHFIFLLVCYFGLPDFLLPRLPQEPTAITVEILPITGITNVKPSEAKPAVEPKPEEQKTQQKEAPPVNTAQQTPPPPPPEEKPAEKKEEKKPEEKKKEKPKDDLAAVLKAVKDTAQKEKKDEKKKDKSEDGGDKKAISNNYNPELPMSLSEKDAIASQFIRCWIIPAGAKDAHNLVVTLRVELNMDGSVLKVELASSSKARYYADNFFRAAADSAIRAVHICSPLKDLPPEKYATWKDMELNFDPNQMLR